MKKPRFMLDLLSHVIDSADSERLWCVFERADPKGSKRSKLLFETKNKEVGIVSNILLKRSHGKTRPRDGAGYRKTNDFKVGWPTPATSTIISTTATTYYSQALQAISFRGAGCSVRRSHTTLPPTLQPFADILSHRGLTTPRTPPCIRLKRSPPPCPGPRPGPGEQHRNGNERGTVQRYAWQMFHS